MSLALHFPFNKIYIMMPLMSFTRIQRSSGCEFSPDSGCNRMRRRMCQRLASHTHTQCSYHCCVVYAMRQHFNMYMNTSMIIACMEATMHCCWRKIFAILWIHGWRDERVMWPVELNWHKAITVEWSNRFFFPSKQQLKSFHSDAVEVIGWWLAF